jgi:hypothetical protein
MKRSKELLDVVNKELGRIHWWPACGSLIYSYAPGKSCEQVAHEITNFVHEFGAYTLISLDIKDYFGSITKDHFLRAVTKLGELGSHLSPDIWEAVWAEAYVGKDNRGIAQGNPLSPLISNLVGWACIDVYFTNVLFQETEATCRYWRFSDNIYIVVKSDDSFRMENLLHSLNMTLNLWVAQGFEFKTQVTSSKDYSKRVVLGIRLGLTKPQINNRNWIRSVVYRYSTRKEQMPTDRDIREKYGTLDLARLEQTVRGLVNYAVSVDPKFAGYVTDRGLKELLPERMRHA